MINTLKIICQEGINTYVELILMLMLLMHLTLHKYYADFGPSTPNWVVILLDIPTFVITL